MLTCSAPPGLHSGLPCGLVATVFRRDVLRNFLIGIANRPRRTPGGGGGDSDGWVTPWRVRPIDWLLEEFVLASAHDWPATWSVHVHSLLPHETSRSCFCRTTCHTICIRVSYNSTCCSCSVHIVPSCRQCWLTLRPSTAHRDPVQLRPRAPRQGPGGLGTAPFSWPAVIYRVPRLCRDPSRSW